MLNSAYPNTQESTENTRQYLQQELQAHGKTADELTAHA